MFVVGFLVDHFGAMCMYVATGVAAWVSPLLFVLFAHGFWSACWLHALAGL